MNELLARATPVLLAVLAAAAVLLRSLVVVAPPGGPSWRRWLGMIAPTARLVPAALWCVAPVLVALGISILRGRPEVPSLPDAARLALLGLPPALFTLRREIRSGIDPPPSRLLGVAGALTLLALAGVAADREARLHATARSEERTAQERAAAAPFALASPVDLGPHNAVLAPGPWRNASLRARLVLGENGIAALRLRALRPERAEGITLFLSADPRFRGGFYLETRTGFRPLDARLQALPAGSALDVRIESHGRRLEAFLGHDANAPPVATADEDRLAEGAVVALAATGRVGLEALSIEAREHAELPAGVAADLLRGAGTALFLILAWTWLAAAGRRWPVLRVLAAAGVPAGGFALVLARAPVNGVRDDAGLALDLVVPLLLALLPVFLHARRLSLPRYGGLVGVAVLAASLAFLSGRARAWPPDFGEENALGVTDWSGERLETDLVHLQHPALRRWDNWHARHELRLVTPALRKPQGVSRVLFMGTSSTNGYWLKLPYPFRVQLELREQGVEIETLVGAVPGSTGPRLYYGLRNALLAFEPDVVVLSLSFNDATALTQMDEAAYLRRITAPGYRRGARERLRDRIETAAGVALLHDAVTAFDRGRTPAWPADAGDPPPVRFERMLEDFATLLGGRGIPLVLVKEPVAGDGRRLWKEEFRAAMDRVGAAHGLEVADPTPLLQERGGTALFLPDDRVHPTEDGAQVIAEAIAPAVRRAVEAASRR